MVLQVLKIRTSDTERVYSKPVSLIVSGSIAHHILMPLNLLVCVAKNYYKIIARFLEVKAKV